MGYKEEQEMLRKTGFTKAEINRLYSFTHDCCEEMRALKA